MERYVVLGMARSGIAAAHLLAGIGKHVLICDAKTEDKLDASIALLHEENVEWHLGEDPCTLLDGAHALVVSPGVPDTNPAVVLAKEKGVEVMAEIELAWRMFRGVTCAVTGTNGKTTTTTLLAEIFRSAGYKAEPVGNIGIPFTGICRDSQTGDIAVCEVSSFQMETCSRFRPRAAAVLNITPDHLNRHGTMDVYIGLKKKIFANMAGDDAVILNYDDPVCRAMADDAKCRVIFFSRRESLEKGACLADGMLMYDGMPLCTVDDVYIKGSHNIENALAASAMAAFMGVPPKTIAKTLTTFRGVEHRIETFLEKDGITYINDSKGTNTDSTIKAIRTMTRPTVIILGGSEKNQDFAEMAREMLASQVKAAVLIGVTAPQIKRQLLEEGFTQLYEAGSDFEKAVRLAVRAAGQGWNILLSPANASFDMFTDYEARGRIFKEICTRIAGEV